MTDTNKLKELAEACLVQAQGNSLQTSVNMDNFNRMAFSKEANPKAILGLIAEVERLRKDASIGAVVWQFIDRMTDVCEQDPADRILEQFVAAVRPAIDAALEGGGS